jgi:hypothetical protein
MKALPLIVIVAALVFLAADYAALCCAMAGCHGIVVSEPYRPMMYACVEPSR